MKVLVVPTRCQQHQELDAIRLCFVSSNSQVVKLHEQIVTDLHSKSSSISIDYQVHQSSTKEVEICVIRVTGTIKSQTIKLFVVHTFISNECHVRFVSWQMLRLSQCILSSTGMFSNIRFLI